MTTGCLDGIRVLDLTQYLPGPYAAQLLADLGARVVKVEPPAGDPMRRGGAAGADGIAESYKALNAGKTRVILDLKDAEAAAQLARLVSAADILMESYRPGILDRLGFGPARLAGLNRRLIHCALSGYGQTGPQRLAPGHDLTYSAAIGALAASGTADRPVVPYPPVSDRAGGLYAALAILGALLRRAGSGKGGFIDVAIADAMLAWQSTGLAAASIPDGVPPRAGGAVNGGAACYQLYRTADGRFAALSALEERFWANFCTAAGRADWVARRWEPYPQTALIAELAALFATRTLAQWQDALGEAECCFAPVRELAEVADAPQVAARGMMARDDAGTMGVLFPALFDGAPPQRRAALRDASADEVLAEWEAAGA